MNVWKVQTNRSCKRRVRECSRHDCCPVALLPATNLTGRFVALFPCFCVSVFFFFLLPCCPIVGNQFDGQICCPVALLPYYRQPIWRATLLLFMKFSSRPNRSAYLKKKWFNLSMRTTICKSTNSTGIALSRIHAAFASFFQKICENVSFLKLLPHGKLCELICLMSI
jgi:hypothetical protein